MGDGGGGGDGWPNMKYKFTFCFAWEKSLTLKPVMKYEILVWINVILSGQAEFKPSVHKG